jgi:hypothetical protein
MSSAWAVLCAGPFGLIDILRRLIDVLRHGQE